MDKTTYIKFDRNFKEWRWYKDIATCHLFMHLVMYACYKPTGVGMVDLERGQLLTSLNRLAEDTGLTNQQVRTALKKLEATHSITTSATHQNTLITICNYDRYQVYEEGEQHTSNTPSTHEQHTINTDATYEQQASNKRVTIYNKDKNNNNINNNINKEEREIRTCARDNIKIGDPVFLDGEMVRIDESKIGDILRGFKEVFFEKNQTQYFGRGDDYTSAKNLFLIQKGLKEAFEDWNCQSDLEFWKEFFRKAYDVSDDISRELFSPNVISKQINQISVRIKSNGKEQFRSKGTASVFNANEDESSI